VYEVSVPFVDEIFNPHPNSPDNDILGAKKYSAPIKPRTPKLNDPPLTSALTAFAVEVKFPGPALGAPSRGCRLPDAVLHGKRSHSASQQGRPAPCGHWISSEAFQLAWAGGCATGPQTRSRHDCVCGPRLDHLARGLPPLLAVRSPRATGLASSLSGCVWLTGQRCRL